MYVSTSSDDQPGSPAADPAPWPSRRVFSPEYKLAIVAEYENVPNGEKGAILRRGEGLYSSHVIEWTRARDTGTLTTSGPADPATPSKRPGNHPSRSSWRSSAAVTLNWKPTSPRLDWRWTPLVMQRRKPSW